MENFKNPEVYWKNQVLRELERRKKMEKFDRKKFVEDFKKRMKDKEE